jgi:hypothetical protein
MHPRRWSEKDFDSMSWHDCHVHAFRIVEGEHGTGELELDLDYILQWTPQQEKFSFLLVPAALRFHEVFGLRIALDWAAPTAGLGPFSLSEIERRTEDRARYTATLWRLAVNWPAGAIEFEARGFTQLAYGREVVSQNQVLSPSERVAA